VRQPEFVEYVAAEEFSKPLQLKTARDGLILSVQFVPYVDSQRLLLSRDITQGTRLETMRRDFVANVSHELANPLTVLVGFLETVRELKLDPERSRDYMNLMAEQSRRMQRIIDDLLTLSTLESAPEPPHDEHVDVALLLSRIHSEAQALSGGRQGITLDASRASTCSGRVRDRQRFRQPREQRGALHAPGGEVRLIWRGSQNGAEFTVEDTGVGIEAEHIPGSPSASTAWTAAARAKRAARAWDLPSSSMP